MTLLARPKEQVKDLVVSSFGPIEAYLHGNIWLVLARVRNWSPHVKDLVINSFGPTVTFSHGYMWILMVRPKNRLKLPGRFISPLLIDFKSPSHTSRNTPFASSWLVLHVVYYMGLAPILLVTLHLPVHDWYYVQVYWRGLAPILPIMLRLLVFD
jgi:hypothetical protein